jgi:hypothetical protein
MLTEVDASIKSRRAKCAIRERWIQGSSTQENSLHHRLKHKKKSIRFKKAVEGDLADPVDVRKAMLDADPVLKALDPHRVLCNMCNKVRSYYHPPYLP